MKAYSKFWMNTLGVALMSVLLLTAAPRVIAQAPRQGGPSPGYTPPAPPKAGPVQLDIQDGSTASYRVTEQLAGVNFPNDAIGTSPAVTGSIALNADGTVNSAASKLTIDLRALKSDQEMRDGYLQKRTLETDKFPTAVFVPKTLTGIPSPFPNGGQAGFQLTGDLTVHGKTAPVTWQGIVTFNKDGASGRASTNFTFPTFGLTKPTLARLLSVDDKINLDIVFRLKATRQ
jgi:polyisoprenoid-binding protein YceI